MFLKSNIDYLLEKHKTNPNELSEKHGIPQSTIFRIQNGLTENPRQSTLRAISEWSGVDVGDLLTKDLRLLESGPNEAKSVFNKLDIEAFKKQHNILDCDEAVLFSKIIEKPFVISKRWVPVKAYSKMGMDGYFTDMGYEGNAGDGYIPTHSAGDKAYGIKGTGDSMYPAIRNGWYVVCDPDAEPTPTEFVQVCLKDGRCTIKEFIGIHNNVLNLLAVNGGEKLTFDMDEVESITAITDIVPPSQHKQDHPNSY
ncbi:S24 family peptidase [Acinetobacter junii]|uniref:S24 family peptidase n=1 Tax=Acinetobacter junii TaxID=40215 RepID=UPI0012508260|nr:S24 family peptidase [Acinetobacter junii]